MDDLQEKLTSSWVEDKDGSIDWLGSQVTLKCLENNMVSSKLHVFIDLSIQIHYTCTKTYSQLILSKFKHSTHRALNIIYIFVCFSGKSNSVYCSFSLMQNARSSNIFKANNDTFNQMFFEHLFWRPFFKIKTPCICMLKSW